MNNRDLKAKLMTMVADALKWFKANSGSAVILVLSGIGVVSLLVLLLR